MPRYGTPDMQYAMQLATCPPDQDGPVFMINFMKYRERAEYEGGGDQGRSGREADDEYAPLDVLADIGAVLAFAGDVVEAEQSTGWDRIGIVQYPSRKSFIDMQSRTDFREKHTHKEAGMERTIVFAVPPAAMAHTLLPARTPQMVFDLVRHEHGPSAPLPGQALGAVEGTIMGDGRAWTEVRITWCDAAAAAADPVDDRERVVVTPRIDRLAQLITAAHPSGSEA